MIVLLGFISTFVFIYLAVKTRQKPKFRQRLIYQVAILFLWLLLALETFFSVGPSVTIPLVIVIGLLGLFGALIPSKTRAGSRR